MDKRLGNSILAIVLCLMLVGAGYNARAQFAGGGGSGISLADAQAWVISQAYIQTVPISGGTATPNVFTMDFTFTPGSISALVANVKTVAITGLLTTDAVSVNAIGGLPLGANIANARVSSAGNLELTITTAVVLGITLGSTNFRLTVFRA